jgi:hypothetical protein
VTFSRIPYSKAACRARWQDRMVYAGLAATALVALLLVFRFLFP